MLVPRVSRPALAAAVLTGVIALAGCTPVATPIPRPTTPSISATPAAATTRQPTLPLSCAQLLPASQVTSMFGTPVSLRIDERRAPGSMVDVATQQVGGMQCVWGGQTRTDNGYDDTIELTVLPAGASDYANFAPPTVSTNGAAIDTAGDHSESSCQSSGDTFSCSAQLLVGQYWVTIIYTNSDGAGPPRAAASALLQTSLQQLATSIRAAGSPRPPFVPSSSAWSGAALCGAGSEANVQAAFGSPLTQSQDAHRGAPGR